MNPQDLKKRILAAYDLLSEETTTWAKFESIRTLIEGRNSRIDQILSSISKFRSEISKLQEGDIIQLSAENLPEKTEKEKKRKKAILLFIRHWKQLKAEVERVKREFNQSEGKDSDKTSNFANIATRAKGPLGLITIAAVIIVVVGIALNSQKQTTPNEQASSPTSTPNQKIKVIDFNGKKIPLSELITGIGPECTTNGAPAEHYHAPDHQSAKVLDGSSVLDPGGCGFGKLSEVEIEEISL